MLNIINILLSVCITHINCNLVECVKNRKASKKIVEDSHLEKAVLVKEIFLAEHLFIYHVLYFTKEDRSKLHPIYSCSDDLYHLIKQTVKKALKTPEKSIINSHVQPAVGPQTTTLVIEPDSKSLLEVSKCENSTLMGPQKRSSCINIQPMSSTSTNACSMYTPQVPAGKKIRNQTRDPIPQRR